MSLLNRLLGTGRDPREGLRPLWHAIVARSRQAHFYAQGQVQDSVAGRFDMITLVFCMVVLRLEDEPDTARPIALLIELFVEDMDGQLRETGVGDLMVGKHMGKLVSVLGGRMGAVRRTLAQPGDADLAEALARNCTLASGAAPDALAAQVRDLQAALAALPVTAILAGDI